MPFAAKSIACAKNGNIKKGFRVITDKNGKERYMTDIKTEPKKKVIKQMAKPVEKMTGKKDVKKDKKENVETKKPISKGVSKKKEILIDSDEDRLTLHF